MKTTLYFAIFILLISTKLKAQEKDLAAQFNGTYNLLEPERGVANKPTSTKIVEFGENNGTKLLAVAACKKCMPAVYTYQEKESEKYGISIFLNKMGLYALEYDNESFIIVLVTKKLGDGAWNNFSFSNFYSKNASKVKKMTKEKITTYATSISKKFKK